MELFVSYPFNNILHKNVVSMLTSVLRCSNRPVVESLFVKLDVCTWLIEMPQFVASKATKYIPRGPALRENGYSTEEEEPEKLPSQLRAGYLGHAILLSNQILQAAQLNQFVAEHLSSNKEWQKYVANTLVPVNKKEDLKSWICGRPPDGIAREDSQENQEDTDLPSSSNGALYNKIYGSHPIQQPLWHSGLGENEEDKGDESGGVRWRSIDVLTSEGDQVTGTAAMFSRIGLHEAASRMVKQMSDSSSSDSSSSTSSHESSSSSSASEDGDEQGSNRVVISPQSLLQNLMRDTPGLASGAARY